MTCRQAANRIGEPSAGFRVLCNGRKCSLRLRGNALQQRGRRNGPNRLRIRPSVADNMPTDGRDRMSGRAVVRRSPTDDSPVLGFELQVSVRHESLPATEDSRGRKHAGGPGSVRHHHLTVFDWCIMRGEGRSGQFVAGGLVLARTSQRIRFVDPTPPSSRATTAGGRRSPHPMFHRRSAGLQVGATRRRARRPATATCAPSAGATSATAADSAPRSGAVWLMRPLLLPPRMDPVGQVGEALDAIEPRRIEGSADYSTVAVAAPFR